MKQAIFEENFDVAGLLSEFFKHDNLFEETLLTKINFLIRSIYYQSGII